MKRTLIFIVILSMLLKFNYAQTIKNVAEFNDVLDSVQHCLNIADEKIGFLTGKPFAELVTLFNKCNVKIYQVGVTQDDRKVPPQLVLGITLWVTTKEHRDFAFLNNLWGPYVRVYFTEGKPYEKAISLLKETSFTKEIEDFFADSVMKYIEIETPEKHKKRVLENR